MSYSILKRVMTRKSIIGFGDYKDFTVQQVMDVGKKWALVKMYYNLDKIDFIQEVKDILGIKPYMEILKPSKNYAMRKKYTHEIMVHIKSMQDIHGRTVIREYKAKEQAHSIFVKKMANRSGEFMTRKNHGH